MQGHGERVPQTGAGTAIWANSGPRSLRPQGAGTFKLADWLSPRSEVARR